MRVTYLYKSLCSLRSLAFVQKKLSANAEIDDDDLIREEMTNRQKRKEFTEIPCKGNPVFSVGLRGFQLVWTATNKTVRYLHCPQCGFLHQMDWMNGWKGRTYACIDCRLKEREMVYNCHVCKLPVNGDCAVQLDLHRWVYVCKKHKKT